MTSVLDPPACVILPSSSAMPEKPRLALALFGHFQHLNDHCVGCGGQNIRVSHRPRPIPSTWDTYRVILVDLQRSLFLVLKFQAGILTLGLYAAICHYGSSGPAFQSEAL